MVCVAENFSHFDMAPTLPMDLSLRVNARISDFCKQTGRFRACCPPKRFADQDVKENSEKAVTMFSRTTNAIQKIS